MLFFYTGATQKLTEVTDGEGDTATKSQFGYYRLGHGDALRDTHHGRMKWRRSADGSWVMYNYASERESLERVTKIVSPYLDTAMPTDLPSANSATGYRITTTTYTTDWEGVKRLPWQITTTANGQQVGYSESTYDFTTTANSQPLWVTTTNTYTSSGTSLTSISKAYDGRFVNGMPVASWLRGLPYSSEGPDGSKETVAYHRGTYTASTKTFSKSDTGLGFRSVVFKGRADASSGGTALSTYDGATIDTIYLIPNVATAEVTLRDDRAFTVRSETLLYTGTGWAVIDSADMQYDNAGNLTRRQKLNGALYEATYVNGRKASEKDEQGLTTNFHYDTEGRVSHTIRAAFGSVPALRTSFTYDDENRILSTTIGDPDGEKIVSTTTYDKSGRVLTETVQGLTTSYTYTITNGILTRTTITLPGDATRILTNYLDGRPKSVTGTAAPAEYYTYAVDTGGVETVTKRIGSETSPRWTKTYSDWAGRTVKTQSSSVDSSGAAATLTQTSVYNARGQLTRSQTDSLAPTIYFYDGNGIMTSYGLDLNDNASIETTERKNSFTYGFRHDATVWSRYGGDSDTWWEYSESFAYPDGATAGQSQSRTWSRVTNFDRVSGPAGVTGVAIAESVAADANGNRAVTQTFLDRGAAKVTTVVWSPFAAQPSISIAVAGRLLTQTSSAGVTVSYGYDALGRGISSTDRTGTSNVAYYTGTTRLRTVTDARGVVQHTYTYDSAGRVAQDQTPKIASGGTASGTLSSFFAYNTRGQLTHIWGAVPYPVKYAYDATYGDRTEQYTYRTAGIDWSNAALATSGWPSSGDKTGFEYYAESGMLWKKTDANNKSVTYTYNPRGQLKTRTWARGTVTTYAYFDTAGAATGALKSATYSDGTPTVSYTYDRMDRLKTVADAAGHRTFTYRTVDLKPEAELFGRSGTTTMSHVLGTTRQLTYRYAAVTGRFIGTEIANNAVAEHTVTYGFDPASGRLGSIASSAGTFRYDYLPNSNLISAVRNGHYVQSRAYEPNRNLLDVVGVDTQAGTIARYDYTCDDLGRRTAVDQSGTVYAPYVAVGEIMRTVYGYDDRNQVTSAATKVGPVGSIASAPALAGRGFGYDFDPIGNRTAEKFDGVSFAYSANSLNQYTGRATPAILPVSGTANRSGGASMAVNGSALGAASWKNNYFFSPVAKAQPSAPSFQSITLTGTASGASQSEVASALVRPTAENPTYDFDGNLTDDSLWRYVYDAENRLSRMYSKVADATGYPVAVLFTNDYMGRRIVKDVWSYSGTPTAPTLVTCRSRSRFAYAGWTLLAEFSASTSTSDLNLARSFTWGLDLSGTLGGAGDIGGLLAIDDLRSATKGTYFATHDGNGNLTALTDSGSGTTVAEYEYDPFGNVLRASGRYGAENPFRFAGKWYDRETGLSYYGFRYYSASYGRFVNRDPLEEAGGWNLYSGLNFAAGNPFAGASGVEGTSWSTEWEQAQSRLLSNSSLPHTTQAVSFDSKKNSGLPGSSQQDQKNYTANATGHYAQGGAPGTGPQAPNMSGGNPSAGNADINLYCYAGNNPVNRYDALGLKRDNSAGKDNFISKLERAGAMLEMQIDALKMRPKQKEEAKAEARKLVTALVSLANENYGNGDSGGPDPVGGYLCWEWAYEFNDTITTLKFKHIKGNVREYLNPRHPGIEENGSNSSPFDFSNIDITGQDPRTTVHFAVEIFIGRKSVGFLDDGYPAGKGEVYHKADDKSWFPIEENWKRRDAMEDKSVDRSRGAIPGQGIPEHERRPIKFQKPSPDLNGLEAHKSKPRMVPYKP